MSKNNTTTFFLYNKGIYFVSELNISFNSVSRKHLFINTMNNVRTKNDPHNLK